MPVEPVRHDCIDDLVFKISQAKNSSRSSWSLVFKGVNLRLVALPGFCICSALAHLLHERQDVSNFCRTLTLLKEKAPRFITLHSRLHIKALRPVERHLYHPWPLFLFHPCPVPCWVHSFCGGTCPRSWVCCCWYSGWRGDWCCCATLCSSLAIRAAPSCASRSWSSAGDTSRSWRRRTRTRRGGHRERPWQDMVSSLFKPLELFCILSHYNQKRDTVVDSLFYWD